MGKRGKHVGPAVFSFGLTFSGTKITGTDSQLIPLHKCPLLPTLPAETTGEKFKDIAEAMGVDTTGMSQEEYRKAANSFHCINARFSLLCLLSVIAESSDSAIVQFQSSLPYLNT